MDCYAVGKIAVPTPGTNVALPACPSTMDGRVAKIDVRPLGANTGVVTFGKTGMVKATGAKVIAELLKPNAGFSDQYSTPENEVGNPIDPTSFCLDVGTANDAVYITYWVN